MAITALAVEVPEAESIVGDLRSLHDPSARLGVPAHITILVPFMAPELITQDILADLASLIGRHPQFDFLLGRVGRFPATAYLSPEPGEPFIALTASVASRFPAFPPFAGEFPTVVPHLTVANGSAALADVAAGQLEAILRERGPVRSVCRSVVMLENSTGRWQRIHDFHLAQRAVRSE